MTESAEFKHHRFTRDGVGLHAVSLGIGRPVVLIHGFPQHWWMWRHTMMRLAAHGFEAIAIDQRGMGGSDIPPSGYTKQSLGLDVLAVMDGLKLERAALVGYDHGGGTALSLAYQAPHRVERLVVIEYAPPGFGYEHGLMAAPGNVNWQLAFFTHPDVAITFIQGKERELLSWYFWHWAHNPEAIDQADFEIYVRQLQKPGALRGGFSHFATVHEDLPQFKTWAAQGLLQMPLLAIGGEIAAGGYLEPAMRQLAETAQTAVIPQCGHWIADEQPMLLANRLIAFLA